MQINSKKAMTLIEVLLVLTIMGTVAALTVPGLRKYSQKTEMENLLKKNYGIINQILDTALVHGTADSIKDWDFTNTSRFMNTYVKPYANVVIDCPVSDTRCFSNAYKNLDGSGSTDISAFAESIIMADGSSLQVHGCDGVHCDFHVDLNGPEGPNIMGYDYFEFTLNKEQERLLPNSEGGDFSTDKIMENEWKITRW